MCPRNTHWRLSGTLGLALALASGGRIASAQTPRPDWRRIGNSAIDLSLAALGTGPVDRVWYSEDGGRLYTRTATGRVFATDDLENWKLVTESTTPPGTVDVVTPSRPEGRSRVRGLNAGGSTLYAIGRFAYRSEDAGISWTNVTAYRNHSIIGDGLADLAISPRNPDEIVVAAATGVWRSVDGGMSWSGLNDGLPNLSVLRLIGLPANTRGARIAVSEQGRLETLEWAPGEKQAWRPSPAPELDKNETLKQSASVALATRITAVAQAGDYLYAGSADGRIWSSSDRGTTWRPGPDQYSAPIEAIFVDPREPRLALAALGERFPQAPAGIRTPHVLRTTNGGGFWDDLSANLPDGPAWGVAADRATGAVYAATDHGIFMTLGDLIGAGPASPWSPIGQGLPTAKAVDVRLDAAGNQLYVALQGYGVFAAPAPHRFRAPRLVNAADLTERPAAPGSLLSVLGANVHSVQVGSLTAPVLSASDTKSEIQVPYEATGTSLSLALEAAGGTLRLGIPLQNASPAILIDQDGAPVVLNAETGVLLDAMTPARSNSRIQMLATGLGRVKPEWPTGMPAPQQDPPQVVAPVRAYLDGSPVEVTRATLAPGYVGFYLLEIELPKLVNYGPAELFIEVDGQPSNRVRVYIEP